MREMYFSREVQLSPVSEVWKRRSLASLVRLDESSYRPSLIALLNSFQNLR